MIFRAMAPIALMLFILTASYAQNDERTMDVISSPYAHYPDIFPYSSQINLYKAEGDRSKRNNAEMINHILKHYGTLSQLGNVGR